MNKEQLVKNKGKSVLLLCLAALAVFCLLCTCEQIGDETGKDASVTITIGSGGSRGVYSQDEISSFNHTITFTGGPGADVEKTGITAGQTVQFTVAPGHWVITVKAYLDGELKAEGFASVNLKSGHNGAVPITMRPPSGEQLISNPYNIVIDITGDVVSGDTVTVSPDSGHEGDIVTLTYTVVNGAHYNLLDFDGVTVPIASVKEAETGTRNYTINASDASDGTITIIAVFEHTDLTPDPIEFTSVGHITKTYGDTVFTNAIKTGYSGSKPITYRSSDESVATVDDSGHVTIHKVGNIVITAEKAADDKYAHALTTYTLMVNPKPVTITVTVANKQYDGTTAATVSNTVINGKIDDDAVSATGNAVFESATVGSGKNVTFIGWSLTGANAGNYTLPSQPASVTANITITIEMVSILAGSFTMGSPGTEPNRDSDRETQHPVTLTKSFYMGKYQVTQLQYQAVMGKTILEQQALTTTSTTDDYGRGDNFPIYFVSWYDAIVFCNKLSMSEGLNPVYSIDGNTNPAVWIAITGGSIPTSSNSTWNNAVMDRSKNGYRLPTEAEWEYACRAGTATPFNTGDNITTDQANYNGNHPYNNNAKGVYREKTMSVESFAPNSLGLYNMHGNVWEWCWDWYKADITADNTDPTGAATGGTNRVLRGGSWSSYGHPLRSAERNYNNPLTRYNDYGFRLVRSN